MKRGGRFPRPRRRARWWPTYTPATISQQALEEATGYPLILYAAVEVDGTLQLFAGASYAYYEFTVPLAERLTDEEWIGMLDSGQAPSRPAWTDEWIVER